MMLRFNRFLLIFLVALSLGIPCLLTFVGEQRSVSFHEKRRLAVLPELKLDLVELEAYPKEFEKWLSDHFGLRDRLVNLNNRLYVSLFKTSPKWQVILGQEKWLFLSAQFVLDDFADSRNRDVEIFPKWKKILEERQQWLNKRGIHYLWMIPPNKISVCPEYLPKKLQGYQTKPQVERFFEYLDEPEQFSGKIDLLKILKQAKGGRLLYYKADTHWNKAGAYLAYSAIMQRLQQYYPEISPLSPDDFEMNIRTTRGGLSLMINLPELFEEEAVAYSHKDKNLKTSYRPVEIPDHPFSEFQHFRTGKYRVAENSAMELKALFISDSFGDALRDFIAPHFKKIILAKDARFEDMTHLIEDFRPDVVIDLNVARAMYIALGESQEVRNEIMADEFARLNEKSLVNINTSNIDQFLEHTGQLKFSANNAGFAAAGADPQMHFTLPLPGHSRIVNFYCRLSASSDDVLKVYYKTRPDSGYDETHMLTYPVKKGTNDVYFRLFPPVSVEKIRIDPGERPGNSFHLDTLQVIAES